MSKIKFAVVGSGRIGRRHASMVKLNESAELVAMVDIDNNIKAEVEKEFGVPLYSSTEELYNNEKDIEVVNICTPNYLHAPQAIEALEKGCHVVVEKPMALNKTDAEKVIHYSLQVNKRVFALCRTDTVLHQGG